MSSWSRLGIVVAGVLLTSQVDASARDLDFEERVRAQRAIEQVYFSHQTGAKRSFDDAVPRALLERKVRTSLKLSIALERFWKSPVTAEMLAREAARISRGTRMPERLAELHAALGGDPFLFRETVARAALVDRLSRNFFSYDRSIHQAVFREAAALQRRLSRTEQDPFTADPRRRLFEVALDASGSGTAEKARPGEEPTENMVLREVVHESGEYERLRRQAPRGVGEVGAVVEERDFLSISVLIEEEAGRFRTAVYTLPKRSWQDWWSEISPGLNHRSVRPAGGFVEPDLSTPISETCVADTWETGSLADLPDGRQKATAVWTGSVVIIWGGSNLFDDLTFDSGGIYDPATDTWSATSRLGAPAPRFDHTAVWTGSEMIIWGGKEGTVGATPGTGGRYDPLTDTWFPVTLTDAPQSRTYHTAVWTGDEMIVWGGFGTGVGRLNTGGRYDPSTDTWSSMSAASGLEPRHLHTAIWTGDRMIVWGGTGPLDFSYLNNGALYDPAADTWAPMTLNGAPDERYWHTAVWSGSQMLVWGGCCVLATPGARYDPAADQWSPMSIVDAPLNSTEHSAIWSGTEMIVWGGNAPSSGVLDTGGRYNPSTDAWTPTSTVGAPAAREEHAAVWAGDRMVIWGGTRGTVSLNTGGRYDPVADLWTPTSLSSAPAPRIWHAAAWTGNLMIIWGGQGQGVSPLTMRIGSGDRFDPVLDAWSPMALTGAPSARTQPTAVWSGDEAIVWGGFSDSGHEGTGARYDPIADSWSPPISLIHAPAPRNDHTAIWTGSRMIVWGGGTPSGSTYTGGSYDPSTDVWTRLTNDNAPLARRNHTAVWTGSRMIIWGGRGGYLDSGALYDPINDQWTATSLTDRPAGRHGHSAVWTGSDMIVWGGVGSGNVYLDSGGVYDPVSDSWSATSLVDTPGARWEHSAVWTGNHMIVWGGLYSGNLPAGGGLYDPIADAWSPTSIVGEPAARHGHRALWTPHQMFIWGGTSQYTYRNTGARYCACTGTTTTYYQDGDGDGAGASDVAVDSCSQPSGFVPDGSDCSDLDTTIWDTPTEVVDLRLVGDDDLEWEAPLDPGSLTLAYDLIRTGDPTDYVLAAACVVTDGTTLSAVDGLAPPVGSVFFYRARAQNDCVDGQGPLGSDSNGNPVPGRDCP